MCYIECKVNGVEYVVVESYRGGKFFWSSDELEGQPKDSPCEAMQDLLDNVSEDLKAQEAMRDQEAEDAKYGTYQQQVTALWKATRL